MTMTPMPLELLIKATNELLEVYHLASASDTDRAKALSNLARVVAFAEKELPEPRACANCACWAKQLDTENQGECRRRPPPLGSHRGHWRLTESSEWCHDGYVPKGEAPTAP